MSRILIILSLFFAFSSCMKMTHKLKKSKTNVYCLDHANLINWGKGAPLITANVQTDSNGVAISANVQMGVLNSVTENWCVTSDIFIKNFSNGLCLNVVNGLLAADNSCSLEWTVYPGCYDDIKAKGGYFEFRTVVNGQTYSLTAHSADNTATAEAVLDSGDALKPYQLWNVHYS